MLAEITLSKGRPASPFASLALYSSDLTASSPLTAYFASLTWGFMLLIFKLRRAVVVDMLREEGGNLKEDGTEGRRRSKYVHGQGRKKPIIHPSMRLLKSAEKKKLEKNRSSNDPTTLHGHPKAGDADMPEVGSSPSSPIKMSSPTYLIPISGKSNMNESGKRELYSKDFVTKIVC
jgi:hypothetical protein